MQQHTPRSAWHAEDFLGYQPQEVERRVHRAQQHPGDFDADPFSEDVDLTPREAGVLRGVAVAVALAALAALAAWAIAPS